MDTSSPPERHSPSWSGPTNPESVLPVVVAVLTAMALQLWIPKGYTLLPRWPLLVLEALLLVVLLGVNPLVMRRRTLLGRCSAWILLAAIAVDNTLSAIVLDVSILTGQVSNDAAVLLGSGTAIFITNIIVFGILYWELDRGGPFARHTGGRPYPDFMFPQMASPNLAKPGWRPTFVDYLYLSITNVLAFSPTDTMPLARWAKLLMTVQAMVALSTAGLVIARAVNVLG
ncbi:MAG: hypothetical protein K2X52_14045 [Mycobacteriaceae bacterium]|nr:hypothetical protein [Mycobacteriaceae bacterium]